MRPRVLLVGPILVALACGRERPKTPAQAPPPSIAPPAAHVADAAGVARPSDLSYVTAYASPSQSSRVAVARRTLAPLARRLRGWPEGYPSTSVGAWGRTTTPNFVLVSPDAKRVAVDWGHTFDLRDAAGNFVDATTSDGQRVGGVSPEHLLLTNDVLFVDGHAMRLSGARVVDIRAGCGGANILAQIVDADRCRAVMYTPGHPHGGGSAAWVATERFYDEKSPRPYEGDDGAPRVTLRELLPNAAVFGADGTAVLTSTSLGGKAAEFHLTSVAADGRTGTVTLPYAFPTKPALSVIPPNIALVGAAYGASVDFARAVHVLDAVGHEVWSAVVPFDVKQPPIDCAGRVCVAGDGLAALDHGRVAWVRFEGERVYATAFEDGSLAVSRGRALHILSRDGIDQQVLSVAAGEAITTPPAIGHDGAVWVATVEAVYVARPTFR